jgi:hypothetical protein
LSMKTKTHFAFRVDIWDDTGDSIVEHVAGVDRLSRREGHRIGDEPLFLRRKRRGWKLPEILVKMKTALVCSFSKKRSSSGKRAVIAKLGQGPGMLT